MALIENFNSYTNGDLNGQGSWSGSALFDIQGTTVQEGAKAVSNVSATGGEIQKTFTLQADGKQRFYFRQVTGALADNSSTFQLKEGSTVIANLWRWSTSNGTDLRYQTGASTYTNFGTLGNGTWHRIDIEWRSSDKYLRYSFDGGTFTSWVAPVNNFTSGIDTVVLMRYNANTTETNFDNFTENEVILTEYIGSVDDTNNFGASSKSAQGFKIASGNKITGFSIQGSKGNTTPCTSFTASIYEGGADPTAGTLKASESFSSNGLGAYTASPTFHSFYFATPTSTLTGGSTQYYLVISPDDGTGSDVIRWTTDTTSPTYADGTAWYLGGWTEYTGRDLNFAIYGEAVVDPLPSVSDTVTVTEDISINIPYFISVFDTVTASEFVGYFDDLISVLETVTVLVTTGEPRPSVFDTISITEDVSIIIPTLDTSGIFDTISTTEDVTILITTLYAETFDTVSIVEDVTIFITTLYVETFDIVTTSEDITIFIEILYIDTFDTITATEDIMIASGNIISDSISVTEDVVIFITTLYIPDVNDTISITEDVQIETLSFFSVEDTVSATEDINIVSVSALLVFEEITITEDFQTLTINIINVDETINVSEDFVNLLIFNFSVSDDVTITEDFASLIISIVDGGLGDTITITENISMVIAIEIFKWDDVTVTEDADVDMMGYGIPLYSPRGSVGIMTGFSIGGGL